MVSGDDTEDDDVSYHGPPPARADRTWRHPAEYAQAARRTRQRRRNRRLAGLAVGSIVAGGLLATFGWNPGAAPGTDTAGVAVVDTAPATTDAPNNWANDVSAAARASTLMVQSATGTSTIALAVAIGPDGFLVTSNRALGDQTTFLVHTQAGTTHEAHLLGGDPDTDVAVLEIDVTLPAAPTAGSAPTVGDQVAVVDDDDDTAWADAVARDSVIAETDEGTALIGLFTLTDPDADAIAGSPIVDADGAVTGITALTTDAATTGVPIDVAVRVAEEIIESGGVDHPWLGVSLTDVGPAVVTAVVDRGPADLAGIEADDHIKAVDGKPVDDTAALVATLLVLEPGHRVELAIDRSGEALTVWFELGARRADG